MLDFLMSLLPGLAPPGATATSPDTATYPTPSPDASVEKTESCCPLHLSQILRSSEVEQGPWGSIPVLDEASPQGESFSRFLYPESEVESFEEDWGRDHSADGGWAQVPAVKKCAHPTRTPLVIRHVRASEAKTLTFVKGHTTIPTLLVQCFKMQGKYFVIEVDREVLRPLTSISKYDRRAQIVAARDAAKFIAELRDKADFILQPTPPKFPLVRSIDDGQWLAPRYITLRNEYCPSDRTADHLVEPCSSFFLHRVLDHCQLAFPSQIEGSNATTADDGLVKLRLFWWSAKMLKLILEKHEPWKRPLRFSHGNLCPNNILVDKEGSICAIVGWQSAGWLPDFWDSIWMKVHYLEVNERLGNLGLGSRDESRDDIMKRWQDWWENVWLPQAVLQVHKGEIPQETLKELETGFYHASCLYLGSHHKLGTMENARSGLHFFDVDNISVPAHEFLTDKELGILKTQPSVNDLGLYH